MIREWLLGQLKNIVPSYKWTIGYIVGDGEDRGYILQYPSLPPSKSETVTRYPNFQIILSSRDFEQVGKVADEIFKRLHGQGNINYLGHKIFLVEALGEPHDIGVENGSKEYSLNIRITYREVE